MAKKSKQNTNGGLAAFVLPKLLPGQVYTKSNVEDVPKHILDSENKTAIEKAVIGENMWPSKQAFYRQFGVPPKRLYEKLCNDYPDYKEQPFLALLLLGFERLDALAAEPFCNRANCKMLATYFRENTEKCLAPFAKHYKQTLPILVRLLQLMRDIHIFFKSMSAPGWLKKIPRSKKITAQFEQFDADIMAAIGSSSLPVIRPIHANMAVMRKYLDESEVGALTVVFLENIIIHGVGGRPAKGMVPELAQQLGVPKATLFTEVHKLFRSAGRSKARTKRNNDRRGAASVVDSNNGSTMQASRSRSVADDKQPTPRRGRDMTTKKSWRVKKKKQQQQQQQQQLQKQGSTRGGSSRNLGRSATGGSTLAAVLGENNES